MKPHKRLSERGFATAGFTDEAEGFSLLDAETHAIDGFHVAPEQSPRSRTSQSVHRASLFGLVRHGSTTDSSSGSSLTVSAVSPALWPWPPSARASLSSDPTDW